jgi:two-component sensor histidine kinase
MKEPGGLRKYVSEMLYDLQKSHEKREEQLSEAAHSYRERMKQMARAHEALVVAYS